LSSKECCRRTIPFLKWLTSFSRPSLWRKNSSLYCARMECWEEPLTHFIKINCRLEFFSNFSTKNVFGWDTEIKCDKRKWLFLRNFVLGTSSSEGSSKLSSWTHANSKKKDILRGQSFWKLCMSEEFALLEIHTNGIFFALNKFRSTFHIRKTKQKASLRVTHLWQEIPQRASLRFPNIL